MSAASKELSDSARARSDVGSGNALSAMSRLRWLPRPLTLAQILSSAAGAAPMLVAAVRMDPVEFTAFAIVALAAAMAVGGARAAVFQPALIYQRIDARSLTSARYAILAAAAAAVGLGLVCLGVGEFDVADAVVVGVAGSLPVVYDWLRYRAIGASRRWVVVSGDAVRLAAVLAVALPVVDADTVSFFVVIGASCGLAVLSMLALVPLRVGLYEYQNYRNPAMWQALDFVVGQFVTSAPLIILGGLGAGRPLGGVRLAQTLLGPLNLAFAATASNIIADGSTSPDHRAATAVIARGRLAAIRLAALATLVVAAVTGTLWITGFAPRGVPRDDLFLGLALVGPSLILSGWASVHAIVLRVLGYQATVTKVRIGIAASTTCGFVLGYVFGDVTLSLVLGFGANAIMAPLLFLPTAHRYYRQAQSGS